MKAAGAADKSPTDVAAGANVPPSKTVGLSLADEEAAAAKWDVRRSADARMKAARHGIQPRQRDKARAGPDGAANGLTAAEAQIGEAQIALQPAAERVVQLPAVPGGAASEAGRDVLQSAEDLAAMRARQEAQARQPTIRGWLLKARREAAAAAQCAATPSREDAADSEATLLPADAATSQAAVVAALRAAEAQRASRADVAGNIMTWQFA